MLVVTWNMDSWKPQEVHERAWHWLLEELNPDIALLQECVPPVWVHAHGFLSWNRAYPEGKARWGTALFSRLPARPTTIPEVDEWLRQLPPKEPGKDWLARVHRLPGWAACANVETSNLGQVLVVSLHNPSQEIERERWNGVDVKEMQLEVSEDIWLLDVVVHYLKRYLDRPLLFGGDFNYSRLLDDLYGPSGNHEFFDRLPVDGFVSLHRMFHDSDQQTFFQKRGRGHQLDYLYADSTVAHTAASCEVVDYSLVSEFSDHAPLIAELDV